MFTHTYFAEHTIQLFFFPPSFLFCFCETNQNQTKNIKTKSIDRKHYLEQPMLDSLPCLAKACSHWGAESSVAGLRN